MHHRMESFKVSNYIIFGIQDIIIYSLFPCLSDNEMFPGTTVRAAKSSLHQSTLLASGQMCC